MRLIVVFGSGNLTRECAVAIAPAHTAQKYCRKRTNYTNLQSYKFMANLKGRFATVYGGPPANYNASVNGVKKKQQDVLKLANVKLGEVLSKKEKQKNTNAIANGFGEDNKHRKEITLKALSYEYVPPCIWVKHDGTMDSVILNTLSIRTYHLLTRSPGMR